MLVTCHRSVPPPLLVQARKIAPFSQEDMNHITQTVAELSKEMLRILCTILLPMCLKLDAEFLNLLSYHGGKLFNKTYSLLYLNIIHSVRVIILYSKCCPRHKCVARPLGPCRHLQISGLSSSTCSSSRWMIGCLAQNPRQQFVFCHL